MKTSFTAIPTTYADVDFRSRLEAQYAAFFDLVGWKWEYEPINLRGWIPDFRVDYAEYGDYGDLFLLVEVKPHRSIEEFKGTVEYKLAMDTEFSYLSTNTVALFGHNPAVSFWNLWGGAGTVSIPDRVHNWSDKWKQAQSAVQWKGSAFKHR